MGVVLPQTQRLIECWRNAADGDIPAWPALHPRAIADLMPFLALTDAEGDGYRIRMSGTGLNAFIGRETTGTALSDLAYGPYLKDLLRDHDEVLRRRLGLFIRHRLTLSIDVAELELEPFDYDTVLLPIRAQQDRPPTRILAGIFFADGLPPGGVEGRIRDWRRLVERYIASTDDGQGASDVPYHQ